MSNNFHVTAQGQLKTYSSVTPEDISMDKLPTELLLSVLTRVDLVVPEHEHVKVDI